MSIEPAARVASIKSLSLHHAYRVEGMPLNKAAIAAVTAAARQNLRLVNSLDCTLWK